MLLPSPSFGSDDVIVDQREVIYEGFFEMQRLHVRHRLFEGGWSAPLTRELFCRDEAVCVLLYDPGRDAVVLIEQFRIGAVEGTASPWLLELVAGIVEPGERDQDVARREAVEEAGAEVGALEKICSYHVSPGGSREVIHLLCGRVDASGLGGIHGLADEGEDIRVAVVDRQSAYAGVASGRINNAPTIIALQWLQLHAERLQKQWGTVNANA